MSNNFRQINSCRISSDKKLKKIINFGNINLTGVFPKSKKKKILSTPLQLVYSKKSKLLQLKHNYNNQNLFGSNYGYRSGLNKTMVAHLKKKYLKLTSRLKLKPNDNVLDIGSNDGTFLNFFSKKINKFGCDPTAKKFKKYYSKDIKIIPKLFDSKNINNLKNKKFKIITSVAMFYDLNNPLQFCKNVESVIHKNGIFHVEIAYLPDIISKLSFDTFCQEHLTYYSYHSFKYLIKQTNFKIIDFNRNSINGGSINFDLVLKNSKYKPNFKKINKLELFEKKIGITKYKTYIEFAKNIKNSIQKIRNVFKKLKGHKIYGFGASTKGNVTLQLCGINNKTMQGIYDINKDKFGSYTPGSKIFIKNEQEIYKDKPDYIVFLIWHFKKTIKEKFKKFKLSKTRYIWLFPKIIIKKNI